MQDEKFMNFLRQNLRFVNARNVLTVQYPSFSCVATKVLSSLMTSTVFVMYDDVFSNHSQHSHLVLGKFVM